MDKTEQLSEKIYQNRFDPKQQKQKVILWQTLCKHFFQRYISPSDTVIDIGAGFCEFINNIQCKNKIALDINPDVIQYADKGVRVINNSVLNIATIKNSSVDTAFASNFFEHLPSKNIFFQALTELNRILRPKTGKLLILQPNIAVLNGRYWDFIDHQIPLSHRSISEALLLTGFRILEVRARFLPYTTKSHLPSHPLLVRLYLSFPPIHNIFGAQAWIVGEKT